MWIGLAWIALVLIGGDVRSPFEIRAVDADGNLLDPAGIYCEWLDDPGWCRRTGRTDDNPNTPSPWSEHQLEHVDNGAARFAVWPGEEHRYGYLSPTTTNAPELKPYTPLDGSANGVLRLRDVKPAARRYSSSPCTSTVILRFSLP